MASLCFQDRFPRRRRCLSHRESPPDAPDGLYDWQASSDALGIIARIDPASEVASKLGDTIIGGLYNTVPHPPAAYLGPKYAWREATARTTTFKTLITVAQGVPMLVVLRDEVTYLSSRPGQGSRQRSGTWTAVPGYVPRGATHFPPPATSVLLVLFSRNHNYIADKILKINERKRWTDPPPTDPAARALQDEEIFQTARLINGGHFMMHGTTSAVNEKWTEEIFNSAFGGKPFDQRVAQHLSAAVFKRPQYVRQDLRRPTCRSFQAHIRWTEARSDGKFSDDDLANILHSTTADPAGAYGARNTPPVLRLVEIMGMEQARSWGVCTMNEFRKYWPETWVALYNTPETNRFQEYESFEEWNPDPEVAVRILYCGRALRLNTSYRKLLAACMACRQPRTLCRTFTFHIMNSTSSIRVYSLAFKQSRHAGR
ncbi:heme peroxidase [Salix suchowensis]|nr:heme peroxidase [Salix suchowensis]